VGRHGYDQAGCEDRSAPPRPSGKHHLCGAGQGPHALGERLEFTAEANPGDFIFIPPYVPHQEINASPDQILECVLVRSDGEAIAINLDIEPVEKPQTVLWVDPIHRDLSESK
jgi:uncharacterized RmlC-like cupin family protein